MKSTILRLLTAIVMFAGLATPVGLAQQSPRFHHYQLIDFGTFGGPLSNINESVDYVPAVNRQGQTVGYSANKFLQTATSNPTACFNIPNISLGFEYNNGSVNKLASLAGPRFCSDADSINDYGEVEGISEINAVDPVIGFNEVRAVVWSNGHIANLGTLGGNDSWSFGINDSGQVIGMSLNATPDPYSLYDFTIFGSTLGTQTRAFLWQKGSMQDLGTLGGPDAWAFFINQFGQIAGNSYTNSTPNASTGFPTLDPFLWSKGKMHDLGSLGGVVGFVGAVNNLGQVVGGSSIATDPGACFVGEFAFSNLDCHPFFWDGGKLIDLTTNSTGGAVPFDVNAINDAGEIVGGANFPQTFDAYLWFNGTATDLGHLNGDCFSEASALNRQGQVVGLSLSCDQSNQRAALWEDGSIVDLNSLIPAGSTLQLVSATTINAAGEIAGRGAPPGVSPSDVFSLGHAFLLIPCDENHPNIKGCDYSLTETEAQPTSSGASGTKVERAGAKPEIETPDRASLRKKRRPAITGFSPASGRVGSQVQVFGKDLKWIDYVSFAGLQATFSIDSTSQLTVTVPNIQGNEPIDVSSRYGSAASPTDFKWIPGPPGCFTFHHFGCSLNPSPGAETCCAGLVCSHISCGPLCGINLCT